MPRETKIVEISEGRDAGKKFLLQELPAFQAEKLATRAVMAAVRGGAAINPDLGLSAFITLQRLDLAGVALMSDHDADQIFAELMKCVQVANAGPDQNGQPSCDMEPPRKWMATDFEDISTIFRLRMEVIELHMGFLRPSNP